MLVRKHTWKSRHWPQCLLVYTGGGVFHFSTMLFEVAYDGHLWHLWHLFYIRQPKHEGTDKERHKTLVKNELTTLLKNINNTRKKKY